MPEAAPKIRLFVADDLHADGRVVVDRAQAHYLGHVMRCRPGDGIALFNGRDGEWQARIEAFGKAQAELSVSNQLRPQTAEPGPWLVFAPIKREGLALMVEKATELGVALLQPVITRRTVVGRLNLERLRRIAVEAAEQCGRLTLPELCEPSPLAKLAEGWPAGRALIFADEGGAPRLNYVAGTAPGALALLVGPEGGFEAEERAFLRGLDFVRPASLGPRILRAETAAIAGLAVLQALTVADASPPRL